MESLETSFYVLNDDCAYDQYLEALANSGFQPLWLLIPLEKIFGDFDFQNIRRQFPTKNKKDNKYVGRNGVMVATGDLFVELSAFEEIQKVECRKIGEIFEMTIPSQV